MLVVWIIIPFVAAAAGARFVPGDWYRTLQKPAWNPPSWLFGPVWTALYAMMGVAAWFVWKRLPEDPRGAKLALAFFLGQLAVNAAWTPVFFGMRNPGLGVVVIAILWIAIGITAFSFYRVSPIAAGLLLPYWAWVSFATVLNWTIWRLNR